jgi:membrane-associated phospholipid phosphatase
MSINFQNSPIGERKFLFRNTLYLTLVAVILLGLFANGFQLPAAAGISKKEGGQVEPLAGSWRTWVLESGSQLRPVPPPDKKATKDEIDALLEMATQRDAAALAQIAYWNSGAPVYRWNEIALNMAFKNNMAGQGAERLLSLLNVAMYDATVAAWDAKYFYQRLRPSEFDSTITTVIPTASNPSYPSEHAVVAGAASGILTYLFPTDAATFESYANEAGKAFLMAGVQYPSDVEAGLDLGRQVAALVIERAKTDGSNAPWDGVTQTGPCKWTGTGPIGPTVGTWKTWVLSSGSEFRSEPPIDCTSPDKAAEMAELRTYGRTPSRQTTVAFFNEYGSGATRGYWYWNEIVGKKIFEYRLDGNSPRSARAYALLYITRYDVGVACFDTKYAYWAIRPFQLDPTFQTLFRTPNHPSYPAAHACVSGATADIMSYLFPQDTASFQAIADDAANSRIWAGIHFRSDVVAGFTLAHDVAQKVIDVAQNDGSE